jgi:opacity protein-like surface antigen
MYFVAKVKEKTITKKKLLLALALMAIVVMGAYAQSFGISAGAGGYFVSDFGGGMKDKEVGGDVYTVEYPYAGGGGFAFVDLTYAELSFGYFSSTINYEFKFNGTVTNNYEYSMTGIDIGIMGKYPIAFGSNLTVYPLVGINYRIALSVTNEKTGLAYTEPGDWSALWFKFGGGLDYSFANNIFVRFGLTYGIRLQNQRETDLVDNYKKWYPTDTVTARLGHGLEVRLAVGYAF